ncbi:MAG: sirohydrochlorin cobaltochelatase [Selenomonadaceae bacterium]|nr:sirohydrochlorin cobaltochelatase [Selenomonadaceae bacterium]MBR1859379.1 sirohydrochlorin cobaltochelatase [Selenomonadaceae bacterium]
MLQQALIFTSFGSADPVVRAKTIDATAAQIQTVFQNLRVVQAYTSNFIRRKLNTQDTNVLSIAEQIDSLRKDGFKKIIILPSHLTAGEEFDNKIKIFDAEDVDVISPLFTPDCNTEFDKHIFNVIVECFSIFNDEELVLIGHGSPHRHNPVYENLQKLADSQNLRVHIGVIEPTDTPNFNDVVNRLQRRSVKNILIAPMLFSGGNHISMDIAGDDNSSWKSRLIRADFNVRICTEGLGTFKIFRSLYIEKLMDYLII